MHDISIHTDSAGFTVISDGTEAGTMRYLYYTRRDCIKLYREKYGLQGKRLQIARNG